MSDNVQQAKTKLHQAKDIRDQRANEFWQRTIQAGRTNQTGARTDEQKQEQVVKPRRMKAL